VASDAAGMADKMQALADAVNTAVTEIGKQTAYNSASKKSGPLGGDRTVRELAQQVISAISAGQPGHAAVAASVGPPAVAAAPAVPAYGSFATLGFSLDRYGKVSFDKDKFLTAYKANPAKIQSAVSDGLAKNLGTVADKATNTKSGTLTASVTGGNSYIKSLNTQVDSWDIRLASKKDGLQRQFSQLEVALGKMKDQSSWLSGQLAHM
jgi:flagellar hook-associated protein 2